ncbi:MAG: cytochrome c3 family protein [Anaerolineales bacterium]|nr:cytochrome c3 family protein [Anaerolineales bacterium]MDP2776634.1 cytochrome c3 family protein [Anaerolineales bacterium]
MFKRLFDWLIQPLGLIAVGIAVLAVFSLAAYGINYTQQPPEQPIQFPHKTHAAFGVQCLYCHPGAAKGPSAGIPAQAKCWACHQQIAKTQTSVLLAPLKQAVESGTPIEWVPVAMVPDFVQFNHRAHVAAGQNCENCHGDMTKVTVAQNPQVFNMGWCLNCHVKSAGDDQEKLVKLSDCGTCHY